MASEDFLTQIHTKQVIMVETRSLRYLLGIFKTIIFCEPFSTLILNGKNVSVLKVLFYPFPFIHSIPIYRMSPGLEILLSSRVPAQHV
jgi:hypothetical protein